MVGEDRRAQILRAAQQVVAERGVAALSVRNVAARAGIGPSTLRHYFPSQHALYDAVLGQAFNAQLDDLRITDTSAPPARRLAECMAQFLPPDETRVPELEAWFAGYAAALGPTRTDQGTRLVHTLSAHARERVGRWLAVLEAEGALAARDRERSTTLLLAVVDGLCLQLLTPGSHATVALTRDILADVIDGLIARAQPGGRPDERV